ncbi:HAMP domain-containing protein [Rhizobiales bacterium]|uniref:methyl-accepting chemotaxis protein n=1 Tax=Hongsoonwoonella zoysiae TaxID=2821844 RepID=UPI0015619851|nr:methyl-accepting chemotaxis protein [Hongsoonwoonella zoysiae]NRG18610.1 HAMP domain-containing protein [Hongsoonwoonella zoysiae]
MRTIGLRMKLALLAATGLLGLIVVGLIGWVTIQNFNDTASEALRAEKASEKLLSLGKNVAESASLFERFLLVPSEDAEAFTKDRLSQAARDLGDLKNAEYEIDDAVMADIEQAVSGLSSSAIATIDLQKELGYDENAGLQGSLRMAVHGIEEKIEDVGKGTSNAGELDSLRVKMLQMRRHEKDFILRGDEKYIGRLNKRVDEFLTLLRETGFDEETKDDIRGLLLKYQERFKAWAEKKQALASTVNVVHANQETAGNVLAQAQSRAADIVSASADELDTTHRRASLLIVLAAAVVGLASAAMAFFIGRSIANPLCHISSGMAEITAGNLEVEIPLLNSGDELQALAEAAANYKQSAAAQAKLQNTNRANHEKTLAERDRLENAISAFRDRITEISTTLTRQTDAMRDSSKSLISISGTASRETESAKRAAESSSQSLEGVAVTTQQLAASVQNIAGQAGKASAAISKAADVSRSAANDVTNLANAAERIGTVVNLISDIAAQTDLLALNATIEAARAGEAGRGFAVVATEVKELATQTSKATEEISGQIQAIQASTELAVKAIKAIHETIDDVDQLSAGISSSVREQESATQEIADRIAGAANGAGQITENVDTVEKAISENNREAANVDDAANSLTRLAGDLDQTVNGFLNSVNAGRAAA